MIWGDGLRTNPGALQARAAQLMSAHSGLTNSIEASKGTDLGPWRGDAARAERSTHRRMVDAMERQADALPRAAEALNSAAQSFQSLQNTQHQAVSRAASWQFRYNNWGYVSDVAGFNLDPRRPFIRADLQRIGVSVTLRLNAADATLAGRLGILAIRMGLGGLVDDAKNAFTDLAMWSGDKIMDGLDWSADKIRDAAEWGKDKVQDVIDWGRRGAEAARPAWERLKDTLGTKPRWLDDLLTKGEVPQISEVAGSALYVAGQATGVAVNFLTGEDKHMFDDGTPWTGTPERYNQPNYGGVEDVMATAMDVYNTHDKADMHDRASIQVTAVTDADGNTRFIVAVPGTTEGLGGGGWFGSEAGTDWPANLKGVGFGTTSATEAAMTAVDRAIEQYRQDNPNARVAVGANGQPQLLLTGHSQGGIIAGNMASNTDFANRYSVEGIVSAGSPQQTLPIPTDTRVYNFNNTLDPVPRVDLGGVNVDGSTNHQPNVTNIYIPHSGSPLPTHTHEQGYYMEGITDLANGNGSPQNQQHMASMNQELGSFFNGTTQAYRVEYGREVQR